MSTLADARTSSAAPKAPWHVRVRTWRPSFNQVVLGIPIVYMLAMYAYPIASVLLQSFTEPQIGFGNFVTVLTDPVIRDVLWITVRIAAIVAIVTVALGFPIAYFMAVQPPRRARLIILLVIIPFWTSVLVRSFAWIVLLGDDGLVSRALSPFTGDTSGMLYTEPAVIIAMAHVLLPFPALIMKGAMDQIDISLVRAARTLGAGPINAYCRVYVPLIVPSMISSGMLVFIMGLGYYITPALVGGSRQTTIAMLIERQVNVTFELPQAATLAVILLVISVLLFVLVRKFTKTGGMVLS